MLDPRLPPSLALQAGVLLLLLPSLHSTIQQQQGRMDGIASQLNEQLPDVQPYLASLAELQGTFDQLPLQPSQLATEAQAEVESLVEGVQQVGLVCLVLMYCLRMARQA